MKKSRLFLFCLLIFILISCTGEKTAYDESLAKEYLPIYVASLEIKRISNVRVFAGESLWEYINGGAELFHAHNFVEVATAEYRNGAVEFVVDVYRFATLQDAFDIYQLQRSNEVEIIHIGSEGWRADGQLLFVKTNCVVSLIGYDDSVETTRLLTAMAFELDKLIPDAKSLIF